MNKSIPIEGCAFLDAVAVGEDFHFGDYNELVGGGSFDSFAQFPQWEGKMFSTGISHAAGRYQFEPATWFGQVNRLGLTDFSPDSQDRAAWDLACRVYGMRQNKRSLLLDLRSRMAANRLISLQSTWTSINVKTWDRYLGALSARQQIGDPAAA